jgi:Ca2+-binding EF-hand superfamily protein
VFKKFLEARYDKRIAQKILVLFDWSNPLKFDKFTERILEFFLQPGTGTDNDYMESVRTLKLMAYNLYDMNNDGMLCESDLFSLLRCMQKDRIFSDES